jgi:hypothetical protein
VPTVDHHDRVFSGKGYCIALDGGLIDFHASGKGSHGHETLHLAAVLELALDGVSMVWACFFQEPLEVVHGQSRVALAAACCLCGTLRAGATRSLIGAIIIIGCSLLVSLLAHLLASLGSLPDSVDGDIGQRQSVSAWARSKLGHLNADGVMRDDAHHFLVVLLGALVDMLKGCNSGKPHAQLLGITASVPLRSPLDLLYSSSYEWTQSSANRRNLLTVWCQWRGSPLASSKAYLPCRWWAEVKKTWP